MSGSGMAGLLALTLMASACVQPGQRLLPGPPESPCDREDACLATMHVYVRMPRAVPRDVANFTILIVAPDQQQIRGTVGTHPVTAETVEARRLLGQNASSTEVSGDFRGEDPERISPYPYAVLQHVRYNGTWHVYVNRTVNGDPTTPYTGLNLANVNSCIHVGFSEPNRTLRIFSGDRAHESVRPVSHAHLTFPYASNFTIERYAADTCA